MSFESFEEIISFAIEKEKEAAAFYEEAFQQEVFSGNRKTFEEFAAEERKHQAMLEGFSKNREKLSKYQFKWVPDLKRSDYMLDLEYEKGMFYTDILIVAMKREEQSLKLYNDLTEKAKDENLIKLFKILAQEEAKHKNILETFYDDYMAEQGD